MLLVSDDADPEVGLGDVPQFDCSGESLVPGRIVVLKGNLELDCLEEFPEGEKKVVLGI